MSEFNFSDEHWNPEDHCLEYTHSDMGLRILHHALLLQHETANPRKQLELERTIGHVTFELAYRTHTMDEYIEMHKLAVMIPAEKVA